MNNPHCSGRKGWMRWTTKDRFGESSAQEDAGIRHGRQTQEVREPHGGRPAGACSVVGLQTEDNETSKQVNFKAIERERARRLPLQGFQPTGKECRDRSLITAWLDRMHCRWCAVTCWKEPRPPHHPSHKQQKGKGRQQGRILTFFLLYPLWIKAYLKEYWCRPYYQLNGNYN